MPGSFWPDLTALFPVCGTLVMVSEVPATGTSRALAPEVVIRSATAAARRMATNLLPLRGERCCDVVMTSVLPALERGSTALLWRGFTSRSRLAGWIGDDL